MANVLNRTTLDYRRSVNDPDYNDPPWLVIAPGSSNETLLNTVERKYLKLTGDVLSEMTQPEKDAVDAADAAARVTARRAEADSTADSIHAAGYEFRALVELINKRDNYLVTRIEELQAAMDAMKASTGAVQNLRDAIPASWLATSTRPRADAVTDYKGIISNGGADS